MRFHSFLTIVGLAIPVLSSTAFAGSGYHAVQCTPESPDDARFIEHGNFGVDNRDTGSARIVHCYGTRTNNGIWDTSTVTVFDRSSANDVSCTYNVTDFTGAVFFTARQSTPAGFLSGAQALPAQSLPPYPLLVDIRCSIPAVDLTHGGATFSHVTSYTLP